MVLCFSYSRCCICFGVSGASCVESLGGVEVLVKVLLYLTVKVCEGEFTVTEPPSHKRVVNPLSFFFILKLKREKCRFRIYVQYYVQYKPRASNQPSVGCSLMMFEEESA